MGKYETLAIVEKIPTSSVFYLCLDRPSHRNALSLDFFSEFPKALSSLDQNPDVGVVVLSGNGDHFCAGLDFNAISSILRAVESSDHGHTAERLRRQIKFMQEAITAIEKCRKPVLAAVHGACIGTGIDIIAACDIRYCTEDAFFSFKAVDVGITADLGALQRLPSIVGHGPARELALSGRKLLGSEARELGLVSRVFPSKDTMDEGIRAVAEEMGGKSSGMGVRGTKAVLVRSRDQSLEEGLEYEATWNSGMLLSTQKRKPIFAKL